MGLEKIREKRKTQRINVLLEVKCQSYFKKNMLFGTLLTSDVSGGGIRLRLEKPLEIGTKLKTYLYFTKGGKPIVAYSHVVWCKKLEKKQKIYFDVGIQYLKIVSKDKERFVFLFCELMVNYFMLQRESFTYVKK